MKKATPQKKAPPSAKPKQKQANKTKLALKMRAKTMIKAMLAGKNQTQAAIEAGYSPSYAKNVGEILENPVVKQTYCQILDAAGATDEACAKVVVDAMKAMRTISCVSGKDAGSGSVDFVDVDDHPVRLKAVDMVHKVRGRYVEKKDPPPGTVNNSININVWEIDDDALLDIARRGSGQSDGPAPRKKVSSRLR